MSQENVEVVRQPLVGKPRSHRSLEERLMVRSPRLGRLVMRFVLSRPPHSWLRRSGVRRFGRRVFEAANRQDWASVFAFIPPQFEAVTPPELVGLGFEPSYRGRKGRIRFQLQWMAELGEFQQEPKEVIDLGDRILLLARMKALGRGSGARFDSEIAYLLTVADGLVVREESWRSHQEGLEAAGLSESG